MSHPEKTLLPNHFDESLFMMPEVAKEFKTTLLPHIEYLNKNKVGQIYQNIFNVTESLPEGLENQEIYQHNYYYIYTDKTFAYQLINGVAKRYQVFHIKGDVLIPHTKSPTYIIPFSKNVINILSENKIKSKNSSTIHRAKSIINNENHYKVHRTAKTKFSLEIQLDNMLVFGENKHTLYLPYSLINRLKKSLAHWANNDAILDITVLNDRVSFFINQGQDGSWEYTISKTLDPGFNSQMYCTTTGIFSIPFKQLWVVAQCQKAKLLSVPQSLRPSGFAYDTLALDFTDGARFQTKIFEGFQQVIYTEDYIKA